MKIRIKDNSVRYRLQRSEVDHLHTHGSIEKKSQLSNAILDYGIVVDNNIEEARILIQGSRITAHVPSAATMEWTQSDIVGMYYDVAHDHGVTKLIIEKDFKCLDDTSEDQSDMYDNPKDAC